ncbi:MAG: hydroxyacid dehydrogenase [Chlamydiae bacterium]|nr:MAG: hydroxyacid dehydrogenase [Chlamydiota bacterium]
MLPYIFFYEAFEEEAEALKRYLPKNISADFSWKTIQETVHENPPAKIISIRTQSTIPVDWADKFDAIITRSTGYDHITDYIKLTGSKISAGYLPLYCNRSVAEQALLLLLALSRKLSTQISQFSSFHRNGLTGMEIAKKNIAIVGVGNIGYEMVKIARGLDMNVLAVDIVKKYDDVNYFSPEEAIRQADIIVCAMNLTSDNTAYFNYETLKKAKKGVLFINIARGEFSPAADLLKLIEENHLGGVALDVYDSEKPLAIALRKNKIDDIMNVEDPLRRKKVKAILALFKKNNVIFTPHNAFNTKESVERKSEQTIEQLINYKSTGEFIWPVPKLDNWIIG